MLEARITQPLWLELPHEIRVEIAKLFNLRRSESGRVEYTTQGIRVKSDGFSNNDLRVISVPTLQRVLGSDEIDLFKLFNTLVMRVQVALDDKTGDTKATENQLETKLTNWSTLLMEMREEAIQTGLLGSLVGIIGAIFNVQPTKPSAQTAEAKQGAKEATSGTKRRGRPTKSIR